MRARERRDDAARHRLADAERIADGEHEIADLETVRIAELDRGELHAARIEPQHGEIGLLVLEDDFGGKLPPVGERHGDLGIAAPLNDVVVGDDHALGATSTPEPSEFWMRSRGMPNRSPNSRPKNGSSKKGETICSTLCRT